MRVIQSEHASCLLQHPARFADVILCYALHKQGHRRIWAVPLLPVLLAQVLTCLQEESCIGQKHQVSLGHSCTGCIVWADLLPPAQLAQVLHIHGQRQHSILHWSPLRHCLCTSLYHITYRSATTVCRTGHEQICVSLRHVSLLIDMQDKAGICAVQQPPAIHTMVWIVSTTMHT